MAVSTVAIGTVTDLRKGLRKAMVVLNSNLADLEAADAAQDLAAASEVLGIETDMLAIENDILDLETFVLGSGTTLERPANAVGVTEVASEGTLTVAVNPTDADSITIDGKQYDFMETSEMVDGTIEIGLDVAATRVAILAAIDGTDAVNNVHTTVTAAAATGDDLTITAITAGVAGDLLASTSDFASGSNLFDAVTLGTTTAGVDGVTAVGEQGSFFFDETLGVPIWWCATGWIIAAGTDADA